MKKHLWIVVSSLMALALVMVSCAPASTPATPAASSAPATPTIPTITTTPTTPVAPITEKPQQPAVKPPDVPKYGGTLTISMNTDATAGWDSNYVTAGSVWPVNLTNEDLWKGDWAKGYAGGYGTNEVDWHQTNDIFNFKMGALITGWKWTIDDPTNTGTIVYQVRQGVHWALNPNSEASRLVGGREMTADDVVFALRRAINTDPKAYIYLSQPEMRSANITKTGPWEVTVKVPYDGLYSAISRLGDSIKLHPPEVIAKYGDATQSKASEGTGPFMLTDYIAGSGGNFIRNPNYWDKDPVGPGKGNQLPYLDGVRVLIILDRSTQLAALRTGKLDMMGNSSTSGGSLNREEADSMKKTSQAMLSASAGITGSAKGFMRTDLAPFNDIRVRKAMMEAIDFKKITQDLYGSEGDYNTFPHYYIPAYKGIYVSLDAPDCPANVKEIYTYSPDKARQILKDAGLPNGFKTTITLLSSEVDYWSIFKDYWSKVGIDLSLDIKDPGIYATIGTNRSYLGLSTTGGQGPTSVFPLATSISGDSRANGSMINDPVINAALPGIRRAAITDIYDAMSKYRELAKYVMGQAYTIPSIAGPTYTFWWPWLRNYSGENDLGYFNFIALSQWLWYDKDLKKSMGY